MERRTGPASTQSPVLPTHPTPPRWRSQPCLSSHSPSLIALHALTRSHPTTRQGITADSLLAAPARAAAGAAADLLAGAHSGGAAGGALTASVEDGTAALGGTYVRGADAAALAAAEAEAEAQLFIEAELAARAGQGRGVEGGEAATPSEGFFAIPAALRGQAAEAGPRIDAYMTGVVEVDIGRGDRLAALEAAEAARRAALGLCGGGGGGASPPAPRGAFPKNFGGTGGRRR